HALSEDHGHAHPGPAAVPPDHGHDEHAHHGGGRQREARSHAGLEWLNELDLRYRHLVNQLVAHALGYHTARIGDFDGRATAEAPAGCSTTDPYAVGASSPAVRDVSARGP
ncbi:MAG: hypothetical protein ACYTFA_03520, partial [Planctomycetota bacterium]